MSTYLGVSKPVSVKLPEPSDFVATREMTAFLHEIGAFETVERKAQRDAALAGLTTVVEAWAARVSVIKGADGLNGAVKSQVRVMPFGSSRLEVATPGNGHPHDLHPSAAATLIISIHSIGPNTHMALHTITLGPGMEE